jgi:4'-phosphopantetheinyl transferase
MIKIYGIKLRDKIKKEFFDNYIIYVSKEKRERIRRFKKLDDAVRSLMGDIIVRIAICQEIGLKNEDLIFYKNKYGKPCLKNNCNVQFNISHSGDWIIAAIHDLPIGVDIQKIQPVNMDIAKRFFTPDEYKEIMRKDNEERLSYFYELWVLKESYIKAVGKGMNIPLNSFCFQIQENKIIFKTKNEVKKHCFKLYNLDKNYKMAVCAAINDFPDYIEIKDLDKLYEELLLVGRNREEYN